MATLEQIIEEARRLSVEEQRRLCAALESLDSNGEVMPAKSYHPRNHNSCTLIMVKMKFGN
jgi:hypothetical protein